MSKKKKKKGSKKKSQIHYILLATAILQLIQRMEDIVQDMLIDLEKENLFMIII